MDYIDVSAIDAKAMLLFAVILWLGWYTHQQTHRWFFALVLTLGLLYASARWTGVVGEHHLTRLARDTGGSINGASQRAKLIGDQRTKTSAGEAGGTNKHYRKHVEGEGLERDY